MLLPMERAHSDQVAHVGSQHDARDLKHLLGSPRCGVGLLDGFRWWRLRW